MSPKRPHTTWPRTCQWFLPDDGPFTDADKCGQPTEPGKPYCTSHMDRAYLERRRRDAGGDGGES